MTLSAYLSAYNPLASMGFVAGDFTLMVSETLEGLDITAESEVSDKILHTAGKLSYWIRVRDVCSGDYKFSADGGSYDRQQMFEMAVKNIETYSSQLSELLVDSSSFTISDDSVNPYRYDYDRDMAGNF